MEKLLTAQEVADQLALKVATIRRMILERRIATVRPSVRAVRIPESEVRRIIEAGYTPRIDLAGRDGSYQNCQRLCETPPSVII